MTNSTKLKNNQNQVSEKQERKFANLSDEDLLLQIYNTRQKMNSLLANQAELLFDTQEQQCSLLKEIIMKCKY